MINANTDVYCIVGNPVRHSFSPTMHNPAFAEIGINAVYTAFEVEADDLPKAVDGIRSLGIKGASVTIPHKVAVIPLLDETEDIARMIGSANTIINRNGKLIGTNTDAFGFYRALSENTEVDGKTVAILGSGGASRALCFATMCYAKPKKLMIFAARPQDKDEAVALADNIIEQMQLDNSQVAVAMLDEWQNHKSDIDIIVNATPLGMHPLEDKSILTADDIPYKSTVMDLVYNPHQTLFLNYAARQEATLCYGIDMLLYQGVQQFELWTGEKAPVELMRRCLEEKFKLEA